MITMTLTGAEVLLLRELTREPQDSCQWKEELRKSLQEKAQRAYRKPSMTMAEVKKRTEAEEIRRGKGTAAAVLLAHAEEMKLRFLYEVEE